MKFLLVFSSIAASVAGLLVMGRRARLQKRRMEMSQKESLLRRVL
jgi:hypothetical protein